MVRLKMLKYGYHPKTGLGPKADGIIEPIQLKNKKEQVVDEYIIEGIGNLFVAVTKREPEMDFKKLTIRDAEPG
ncbi:hypothetical protein T459_16398 [Capsicum annuum]|uniref:G-patch domain-containing protein n=1 Tax=Capsicum annuum TaxID=4072 RepID=A0A2G2Z8L9_CAPAN|nr:hypothetical protein FXO37_10106 [Capsicum annuum]PHT78346.1 hypothetical protein T459_16398 [Capsicum annuum]